MRHLLLALTIAAAFLGRVSSPATAAEVSQLWGQQGEKWSPSSRLPDFSFAGYRRGEESYRIPSESVSVKAFGATGDGRTDDTAAFRQAIAAAQGKVVLVPAGVYRLSDRLTINRSNLVLRGEGSDRTVLEFTRPLEEIEPRPAHTDGAQPTTGWSWGGGLITIDGKSPKPGPTVSVTRDALRGENVLELESAAFVAGDEILLMLHDDEEKSLLEYLYRGVTGDITGLRNWKCQQAFRVTAVDGRRVTLDRGLRFDVRAAWRPAVQPFVPAVTDVGIEGLAFRFPSTKYGGHFRELGYNPVEIGSSAAHCWLRDLRIHNADSGPYIRGTFCTLEGIHLTADEARTNNRNESGHHGISFYAHDCLCTNFWIETRFIHDLTVQSAIGCVFAEGRAQDLSMDHHRWAPYENLFTHIDAGDGTRLYASGGGGNRGLHSAAGATFWNIRARRPTAWPSKLSGDAINVVAVSTADPAVTEPNGRWLETIAPGALQPADLYRAMLQRRLAPE